MIISISYVLYFSNLTAFEKSLLTVIKSIGKVDQSTQFVFYVVDNSKSGTYREQVKEIIKKYDKDPRITFFYIVSQSNLGYGSAHNLVINQIDSQYHLIINPDVFVFEDTLLKAIDYLETNSKVGLLTPAVFGENGEQHFLCKKNPTLFDLFLRRFSFRLMRSIFKGRMERFEMRDCDYTKEMRDVPFCTGCFMFFRTGVLKELNGFDPKFFMYMEDADLSRRTLSISHTAYVPSVKIIHRWFRGSYHNFKLCWIAIQSAFIYWSKWGGFF